MTKSPISFPSPMSHPDITASRVASRLFKVLASSALALSAVTGGLAITAQESKATPWEIITDTMTGGLKEVQTKDIAGGLGSGDDSFAENWSPYVGDKRVQITGYDFFGTGDAAVQNTFTLSYLPSMKDMLPFHVDLDLNGNSMMGSGSLAYTIEINPDYVTGSDDGICVTTYPPCHPGFREISFGAALSSTSGNATATKTIFDLDGNILAMLKPGETLELDNPNDYPALNIIIEWEASDGTVDMLYDNYKQSPGPLPVLGAGAAFGFSRKLRGRIKASRAS